MNRKHLYIFLSTIVFLTVCELFPPWPYQHEKWLNYYSAGYHWRFDPPKVPTQEEGERIIGRTHEKPSYFLNGELIVPDGPEPIIPVNLRVLQNKTRLRGQEILIVTAALAAFLFLFSRLLFTALLLPALLEGVLFSGLVYLEHKLNFNSEGVIEFFPLFIATACASVFLLRRGPFNKFWKIYLFSVASASLPLLTAVLIGSTFNVSGGNGLGVVVLPLLLIAASIVVFPVT